LDGDGAVAAGGGDDFTYVATWAGFVYVAFVIDLYSRAIVGWSAATVKDVAFFQACLRMALCGVTTLAGLSIVD
jgi:transposase InsO family protein